MIRKRTLSSGHIYSWKVINRPICSFFFGEKEKNPKASQMSLLLLLPYFRAQKSFPDALDDPFSIVNAALLNGEKGCCSP